MRSLILPVFRQGVVGVGGAAWFENMGLGESSSEPVVLFGGAAVNVRHASINSGFEAKGAVTLSHTHVGGALFTSAAVTFTFGGKIAAKSGSYSLKPNAFITPHTRDASSARATSTPRGRR